MIIRALSGSLLSHDTVARNILRDGGIQTTASLRAWRELRTWHRSTRTTLGPAAGARTVFDRVAVPVATHLGFDVTVAGGASNRIHGVLAYDRTAAAVMVATAWGQDAGAAWREAVRLGIARGVRWCLCVTGPSLRVFDARRAYSRRFAEFDLALVAEDEVSFAAFQMVLEAAAFSRAEPPLDRLVALSDRHRTEVRASLQRGVRDALLHILDAFGRASHGPRRRSSDATLDEALTVVYRVLFLLFAEARGLVPHWHPIYRDSYTIESLRRPVETLSRPHGLWEALQAIARLAHRGCRAGELTVPPFNGRLFSPAHAPLADTLPLDDGSVRDAVLAVTTRPGREGRERIAYGDLGVEQLGGVYEHLLDFEPRTATGSAPAVLVRGGRRKATGSFYTPRSLTEYVVRRTLAPLVEGATSEQVLALRIVDPAMGSGAFLVAACRYLASAYEQALIDDGALMPGDLDARERTAFRRTVAQRCLFGVDINPMAVQLARLSIWLATLAGDRPLTFLEHHLRTGNSLVGASVADLVRDPSPGSRRRARASPLPLFEDGTLTEAVIATVAARVAIATEPNDTLEQVRTKERTLEALSRNGAGLARWKAGADVWCASWFTTGRSRGMFAALLDAVLQKNGPLPAHTAEPLLTGARRVAEGERFFHWTLEFPEVFHAGDGAPLANPGFDAVIGNPPWDMLRADRASRARATLSDFARGSGLYPLQGNGHGNMYQLFVERSLSLLRRGGRLGMILPSGLATDQGCTSLRRHIFERTAVDAFVSIENRDAIFPIHRGLKFVLLSLTNDGVTSSLPLRAGVRRADALDALPDAGPDPLAVPLPRGLLDRISGSALAVPDIRTCNDLDIVAAVTFAFPALGDTVGWNVHFGRELNATDDRPHFTEGRSGLPVIEGKLIEPFKVHVDRARFHVPRRVAARLLHAGRPYERPRLGYREVASSTNRLTLIAAIIPADTVATHTVHCVKECLNERVQAFLCGVFNSFVANYLVRMRVGTHVSAAIIERLPLPKLLAVDPVFTDISDLATRLAEGADPGAAARLQAIVAILYGLDERRFAHVLDSFPLVPEAERARAMAAFRYIVK